jgi:hypothetical protein
MKCRYRYISGCYGGLWYFVELCLGIETVGSAHHGSARVAFAGASDCLLACVAWVFSEVIKRNVPLRKTMNVHVKNVK